MEPDGGGQQGGGIMGRFENVRQRGSRKRIIPCGAATAEYLRSDYLKPQHLPAHTIDAEANYSAGSNINETRFHKGFHRRHVSDIMPDAARMEAELLRDASRQARVEAQVEAATAMRERHTFNILNGEGVGRDTEFQQVGKRVLNPNGSMPEVFPLHTKQAQNRIRNSKHRFFENPAPEKEPRTANLFKEGLQTTVRESAVIGFGAGGNRRTRSVSCGAADNYAHLRELPPEPEYEPPRYGNRSQIIFG